TYQGLFHFIVQQNGCSTCGWLMKINFLRGFLLSATQPATNHLHVMRQKASSATAIVPYSL
ncbi:hypothetical protein, partial [Klebsiella michiganensis]